MTKLQLATWSRASSVEPVQSVNRTPVEGYLDECVARCPTSRSVTPCVMDQHADALVAGARNVELCGMFSASSVRLGDGYGGIVEPDQSL